MRHFIRLNDRLVAYRLDSCAVRQSLGEPDPFRLRHRAALRDLVGEVVRRRMDRKTAVDHIVSWTGENIDVADRDRFRELAKRELLSLHEGNFARYRIRPSEFEAWQKPGHRSLRSHDHCQL